MGSLKRSFYTIPLPDNSVVVGKKVSWIVKGKKKTGVLTGNRRVRCQTEIWTAQFVDEDGITRRISTKTKDRTAAMRILARYEAEVDRIRAGVLTRSEIQRSAVIGIPVGHFIEQYRRKLTAAGNTLRHADSAVRCLNTLFSGIGAGRLSDITQYAIEGWTAAEVDVYNLTTGIWETDWAGLDSGEQESIAGIGGSRGSTTNYHS
ncbi:hypothetical protein FACS189419_08070 [Planctomycetales bacterium]|nr:hypothetical protein FACS189419_08070 [Planctomycetales bacterium]